MTLLSPSATYHAELREQLGLVGRALSVQRALMWLARGFAAGTVLVLGLVVWAWARDAVAGLFLPGLAAVPITMGLLSAIGSLLVRHKTGDLARRVDRAARLQERSTTALELGGRGEDFPLALAQMRDAVENLKRVDLLEAFPMRVPKNELMTAFFVVVVAALIGVSPNPWLLRARASNPAITIAREQAQRVQRLAESLQPEDSAEIEALRQLISKGARTIDVRSNEPDAALNALQDLEEQVRQMSAGDDQLAASLAAIASALASDPATQQFANAINTGDMREISRSAKDLARTTEGLTGQDRERVGRVLRDASNRAGRVSQSVAGQLSEAADAMQGVSEAADGQMADQGQAGQGGATAPNGRSARDALNRLGSSAAAAGEHQRAASQLESSRNALERALGRTQSRSGSSGRSSSGSGRNQANTTQAADHSEGGGRSQSGEPGDGTDANGGGSPGSDQGEGGDTGQGSGYASGGQSQNRTGAMSQLDSIMRPEQLYSGGFAPDESSANPYLGQAGESSARAGEESVQPSYSRKPTLGNESGSIPLGLRDLVKDYFSSLDQK